MERRETPNPLDAILQDLQVLNKAAKRVPLTHLRRESELAQRFINTHVVVDNFAPGGGHRISVLNPVMLISTGYQEIIAKAIEEGMVGLGHFMISPSELQIEADIHTDKKTLPAIRQLLQEDFGWFLRLNTTFNLWGSPHKYIQLPNSIPDDRTGSIQTPAPASSHYRYGKKLLPVAIEPGDIELINFALTHAKTALQPWMK